MLHGIVSPEDSIAVMPVFPRALMFVATMLIMVWQCGFHLGTFLANVMLMVCACVCVDSVYNNVQLLLEKEKAKKSAMFPRWFVVCCMASFFFYPQLSSLREPALLRMEGSRSECIKE